MKKKWHKVHEWCHHHHHFKEIRMRYTRSVTVVFIYKFLLLLLLFLFIFLLRSHWLSFDTNCVAIFRAIQFLMSQLIYHTVGLTWLFCCYDWYNNKNGKGKLIAPIKHRIMYLYTIDQYTRFHEHTYTQMCPSTQYMYTKLVTITTINRKIYSINHKHTCSEWPVLDSYLIKIYTNLA